MTAAMVAGASGLMKWTEQGWIPEWQGVIDGTQRAGHLASLEYAAAFAAVGVDMVLLSLSATGSDAGEMQNTAVKTPIGRIAGFRLEIPP